MSKEFSAYGNNAKFVDELVEKNNPRAAELFFSSLNVKYNVKLVRYIDTFENAMEIIQNDEKATGFIIVTTIKLKDDEAPWVRNRKGTHSVFFIYDGRRIFFYDPNGSYDVAVNTQIYAYDLGIKYEEITSTKAFKSMMEKKFNIPFIIPTTPGIQMVDGEKMPEKSIYIDGGGYCMFYNWWAIDYILSNWVAIGRPSIMPGIEKLYIDLTNQASQQWKMFVRAQPPSNVELASKSVVDYCCKIFKMECTGKDATKKGGKKRKKRKTFRKKRRRKRKRRITYKKRKGRRKYYKK